MKLESISSWNLERKETKNLFKLISLSSNILSMNKNITPIRSHKLTQTQDQVMGKVIAQKVPEILLGKNLFNLQDMQNIFRQIQV